MFRPRFGYEVAILPRRDALLAITDDSIALSLRVAKRRGNLRQGK